MTILISDIQNYLGDRQIDFALPGTPDYDNNINRWNSFARHHAIALWRTSDLAVSADWKIAGAHFATDDAAATARAICARYDQDWQHYRERAAMLNGYAVYNDSHYGEITMAFTPIEAIEIGQISPKINVTLTANGRSIQAVGHMRLKHGAADILPEDVDGRGIWKALVGWHPGGHVGRSGYQLSVMAPASWDEKIWRSITDQLFS
jgi:hypothetical protein